MLIIAILVAVAFFTAWHKTRLHFNGRLPAFRLESTQQNGLQVRRYPSAVVAEVRVSGTASGALHSGYMVLNKYFRDERIGRYALPVLAEKVDAADSIWCDRRAHFHARTGWPFCRAASASPWGSRGPVFRRRQELPCASAQDRVGRPAHGARGGARSSEQGHPAEGATRPPRSRPLPLRARHTGRRARAP